MSPLDSHDVPAPSDAELIDRWLHARDQDAARALIARLHPRLAAIAAGHRPHHTTVDELVQDIMVQVFKHLPAYQPRRPLVHWVSRIALNLCRDRLRAAGRRPELRACDLNENERRALAEGGSDLETQEDEHRRQNARALVARLLETLEADDRIVLTLLELEDRTVAEISALTGWTQLAVRARALRARRRARLLAERLAREL